MGLHAVLLPASKPAPLISQEKQMSLEENLAKLSEYDFIVAIDALK